MRLRTIKETIKWKLNPAVSKTSLGGPQNRPFLLPKLVSSKLGPYSKDRDAFQIFQGVLQKVFIDP